MKIASIKKRILAYVLDMIPIFAVVFFIFYNFFGFDELLKAFLVSEKDIDLKIEFLTERNKIRDLSLFVWVLYGLIMDSTRFQGTHGKVIMKIKIVNSGGYKISLYQSFRRTLMKMVGGIPLFIGWLWAVFRKDKTTWHDIYARTYVVES